MSTTEEFKQVCIDNLTKHVFTLMCTLYGFGLSKDQIIIQGWQEARRLLHSDDALLCFRQAAFQWEAEYEDIVPPPLNVEEKKG